MKKQINLDSFQQAVDEKFEKEDKIKKYIQADIRLIKIQNILILIATILMALIVVLFTIKAMYSIKSASASVLTSCSVPETHLNSAGWEKVRCRDGFVYYKLEIYEKDNIN